MARVGAVADIVNLQLSRHEARELFDLLTRTPAPQMLALTNLEEGLSALFVRDAA